MQTVEQVLKSSTIEGFVVKLPAVQLDRKLYSDTAKKLELIGGKWNRKHQGFLFQSDPSELMESICNGDTRNIKKEYQFFATPPEIADWLVSLAPIKSDSIILEPSAGQSAIVDAIRRAGHENLIFTVEKMATNQLILNKKYYGTENTMIMHPLNDDFLEVQSIGNQCFDIIIANPPFSKNQDIDHIYKMYDLLNPGGTIVTIASRHWLTTTGKKEDRFRDWLNYIVKSDIKTIEAGAFKSSGTMVSSVVIIIKKP